MSKSSRLRINAGMALAILLCMLFSTLPALAEDNGETTIGEVVDPGILPGSGFYFIKSWGRNLQMMFAGSDTEKARLMLKYASEDALALKRLCDTGKCDVAARHAEKYEMQIQNAIQKIEQVRVNEGEKAYEELASRLEKNYLRQQQVLLDVLEKAPEAAQNGILNAIENSNKHMQVQILTHQGEAALAQYQHEVNQQTNNMGESTRIKVQQRLLQGQAEQSGLEHAAGQQNMQNQGSGPVTDDDNETQSNSNNKGGK